MQKDFIASASVIGENPLDGWNETSTNDTDPEPNKCLLLADALNDGASNADIIDGEHDEPFLNQTFIVDFGDCKCENWGKSTMVSCGYQAQLFWPSITIIWVLRQMVDWNH